MIKTAAIMSAAVLLFQCGPPAFAAGENSGDVDGPAAKRISTMQTNDAPADFIVPRGWLNSRVTLAEIEGPERAPDLIRPADSPAWRAFKDKLKPQDELWYFTSPPASFGHGAGRTGYAILRDGRQVASFTALMN